MRHGRGIILRPIIKKALPGRPGLSGRLTQMMPYALPGRVWGDFTHTQIDTFSGFLTLAVGIPVREKDEVVSY